MDKVWYLKANRDKVISEYKFNEMLLDNDSWDHVIRLRGHNIIII